jgi:hypothetical protein
MPDPVAYTKEQLRGDKLQKLIDNADYDEDLQKIKDALEFHDVAVPPSLMPPSKKRGGKVEGSKSKARLDKSKRK